MDDKKFDFDFNGLDKEGKRDAVVLTSKAEGLYKAYLLTKEPKVLEAVVDELLLTIGLLIRLNSSKPQTPSLKKIDDFAEFWSFLIESEGMKDSTIGGYVRALKRVMKSNKMNIAKFNDSIDELIGQYEGNDEKYHNTHASALKKYKKFLVVKGDKQ